VYRGNPHRGRQGVYTRYVAREIAAMGHHINEFSGQPRPNLDDPSHLVKVPGLDLYRSPDPFRVRHVSEFRDTIDARELALMRTSRLPEHGRSASAGGDCGAHSATTSISCTTTSVWAPGSSA